MLALDKQNLGVGSLNKLSLCGLVVDKIPSFHHNGVDFYHTRAVSPLRSKYLKALPQAALKTAESQGVTSSRPSDSSMISGIAVPTMVYHVLGVELEEFREYKQDYSLSPESSRRYP